MQPVDLQRLIQIIVEEVTAAQSAPAPSRCACHSLLYECCPDRLRGVLDAGATRLGLHASGGAPGSVASMIDHTLLKPDATRREIEALCARPLNTALRACASTRRGSPSAQACSTRRMSEYVPWWDFRLVRRLPTRNIMRLGAPFSTVPERSIW
jgi:hypothetical protein